MTPTLHPAARLRRSGDGNIALGTMAHTICDEHERIARELGAQNADMWLEALCGLLGGMVEPVRDDGDDGDDDCPTCDAVLDTLAECHGMSLCGPTAADVAESARDWIGDLIVERDRLRAEIDDVRAMLDAEIRQHAETSRDLDEAHAEVERLRAEVASLRERLDDADEWEPGAGWLVRIEHRDGTRYAVWHRDGHSVTHKAEHPSIYMCDTPGDIGPAVDTLREAIEWCEAQMTSAPAVGAGGPGAAPDADESDDGWEPVCEWIRSSSGDCIARRNDERMAALVYTANDLWHADVWHRGNTFSRCRRGCLSARAAMRWCEAQPEMADVIAAYNSAPTVGAPDAGPDAPALIVEGDDGTGAREARAVPAAPVSPAEQLDEETGVDRPAGDLRGPDAEDGR